MRVEPGFGRRGLLDFYVHWNRDLLDALSNFDQLR
jgi:hypothetical protein